MRTFEPRLHLHTYMHSFEPQLPALPIYMHPEGRQAPNDTSPPDDNPPLVTAAHTHRELAEAGPKCPACTPARTFLEVSRSGQKPPAYTPCSTCPPPCQKWHAYTPWWAVAAQKNLSGRPSKVLRLHTQSDSVIILSVF